MVDLQDQSVLECLVRYLVPQTVLVGKLISLENQFEESFDQVLLLVDEEEQVLHVGNLVIRVYVLLGYGTQLHLEHVVYELLELVLVEEGFYHVFVYVGVVLWLLKLRFYYRFDSVGRVEFEQVQMSAYALLIFAVFVVLFDQRHVGQDFLALEALLINSWYMIKVTSLFLKFKFYKLN